MHHEILESCGTRFASTLMLLLNLQVPQGKRGKGASNGEVMWSGCNVLHASCAAAIVLTMKVPAGTLQRLLHPVAANVIAAVVQLVQSPFRMRPLLLRIWRPPSTLFPPPTAVPPSPN